MAKTTTTFQIDTKLHHDFKVALAKKGESMTDVLQKEIEKYVKKSNS